MMISSQWGGSIAAATSVTPAAAIATAGITAAMAPDVEDHTGFTAARCRGTGIAPLSGIMADRRQRQHNRRQDHQHHDAKADGTGLHIASPMSVFRFTR